jgi:hypothetical protein
MVEQRSERSRWSGRVIFSVRARACTRDHLCTRPRDARACAGKVGGPRGDHRQPAVSGCQTDFAVKHRTQREPVVLLWCYYLDDATPLRGNDASALCAD